MPWRHGLPPAFVAPHSPHVPGATDERTAARQVAGLVEILTFPFPIWRDSYQPLLPSDIPYIHGGYAEFPPEVGNESKYPYVRDTHHDFN